MRETKYRMFSNLTNKMYYDVELLKKTDGMWFVSEGGMLKSGSESDRIYVMEFFGLMGVDSAGVWEEEIWESDIVSWTENGNARTGIIRWDDWSRSDPGFVIWTPDDSRMAIAYRNEEFGLRNIGNIYQNPDLQAALQVAPHPDEAAS